MTILKPLFLILSIFYCISCNSQEKTSFKILKINSLIDIFYNTNEIDFDNLKARLTHTSNAKFEKLKSSVSKERLDAKAIQLFNENFTREEIDELYHIYKNMDKEEEQRMLPDRDFSPNRETTTTKTSISPELKKKRDLVFKKLINEGYKVYENFRHEFYILDSINYETLKKKEPAGIVTKKKLKRVNGLYEVINYKQDSNNYIDLDSIIIKEKPSIRFSNLKNLKVVQENYGFNYAISLVFKKEDAEKFYTLTNHNIDKPIAIVVDGEILMAPIVTGTIPNGKIEINGNITFEKAKTIVGKIQK